MFSGCMGTTQLRWLLRCWGIISLLVCGVCIAMVLIAALTPPPPPLPATDQLSPEHLPLPLPLLSCSSFPCSWKAQPGPALVLFRCHPFLHSSENPSDHVLVCSNWCHAVPCTGCVGYMHTWRGRRGGEWGHWYPDLKIHTCQPAQTQRRMFGDLCLILMSSVTIKLCYAV